MSLVWKNGEAPSRLRSILGVIFPYVRALEAESKLSTEQAVLAREERTEFYRAECERLRKENQQLLDRIVWLTTGAPLEAQPPVPQVPVEGNKPRTRFDLAEELEVQSWERLKKRTEKAAATDGRNGDN